MSAVPRYFAIIPAAGESKRMGQPKLLLPVRGKPLIAHTIDAWLATGLKPLVVLRQRDAELADVCRACGAAVIQPDVDPPEMKDSVLVGLEHVAAHDQPQSHDAWLLAPADMPALSPAIVCALLREFEKVGAVGPEVQPTSCVLVPTLGGKRGHPVLFPWPLATEVKSLGPNEGIKALTERHPVVELVCDDLPHAEAFADVDTPGDYQRLA